MKTTESSRLKHYTNIDSPQPSININSKITFKKDTNCPDLKNVDSLVTLSNRAKTPPFLELEPSLADKMKVIEGWFFETARVNDRGETTELFHTELAEFLVKKGLFTDEILACKFIL